MRYLSQWFSLRIDHLGCLLLLLVSLFVTLGRGSLIQASAAALVLNFAGVDREWTVSGGTVVLWGVQEVAVTPVTPVTRAEG